MSSRHTVCGTAATEIAGTRSAIRTTRCTNVGTSCSRNEWRRGRDEGWRRILWSRDCERLIQSHASCGPKKTGRERRGPRRFFGSHIRELGEWEVERSTMQTKVNTRDWVAHAPTPARIVTDWLRPPAYPSLSATPQQLRAAPPD
jgi:hypothetical protein